MSILQSVVRPYVEFDPNNKHHMEAFDAVSSGRQHPELRFLVSPPHTSTYQMMLVRIAKNWSAHMRSELPMSTVVPIRRKHVGL